MKKETKSLVVRFSDKISETETTHERVKAIADRLGISQNKAVHYAINLAHNQIIGQQVGCITRAFALEQHSGGRYAIEVTSSK